MGTKTLAENRVRFTIFLYIQVRKGLTHLCQEIGKDRFDIHANIKTFLASTDTVVRCGCVTPDLSCESEGAGDCIRCKLCMSKTIEKRTYTSTVMGRGAGGKVRACLLYTSPSPRDLSTSRMPSSA